MSTKSAEFMPGDQLQIGDQPQELSEAAPTGQPVSASSGQLESGQPPSQRLAEAQEEVDRRLDNYPKTGAQNRQDVGGAVLTGEDIEAIEVRAIMAAHKLAKASPDTKSTKKPHRGKRAWDPKGGGPPEHVAREIREGYPPEDDTANAA